MSKNIRHATMMERMKEELVRYSMYGIARCQTDELKFTDS